MEAPETQAVPLLVTEQGDFLNPILARSQREFTLHFLRHSIDGTPMRDRALTDAHMVEAKDHPFIAPVSQPLTIVPSYEDTLEYGRRPYLSPLVPPGSTDRSFRRFTRESVRFPVLEKIGDLTTTTKALNEMHRSSVAMAMEHVLDCAEAEDTKAFIAAQRVLENAVGVGLHQMNTYLESQHIPIYDREEYFADLKKGIVATVVRNRLQRLDGDAAKQEFVERYQACLEAYEATLVTPSKPPATPVNWADKVSRPISDRVLRY